MRITDLLPTHRNGRAYTIHYGGPLRDAVMGMTVEEMYRTQPELQAVVSFIARNVAQLPLKCYTRVSDEDRPRDTEGALPLLLSQPGGGFSTYDVIDATISDICLYGRYLWWVMPSADSPSGWEMRHIPSSWVVKTKTKDGFRPSSYVIKNPTADGLQIEVPAEQFVTHVMYNPGRPATPLSPVESLKQVLAERASSREYRNRVWRNGGWFSRYIKRPKDTDWSNEARARFARSWKTKFSGKDGTDTGGTPILEDGMELVETRLNAKEAEWADSMRLTREDVAAAYHVNPSQVWSNDGQTYASVKENARSLYSDTLGPYLAMIKEDIHTQLVPMIGADPRSYAEFDLTAKLAGSFEETASVLSTSTGAPFMTRNEARARQNLPAIEGGDELITPLNVLVGGLASPQDTDPTADRYSSAPVAYLEDGVVYALPAGKALRRKCQRPEPVTRKSLASPPPDAVTEISDALSRFAKRQSRRVLSDIAKEEGTETASAKDGEGPPWWDGERWDRELADDLAPIFQLWVNYRALEALADLGLPHSLYVAATTAAFVRSMAETRARAYNEITRRQLADALAGTAGDDNKGSTPEGVFDMAAGSRAERGGESFATSISAFATTEAARQAYPQDTDELRRYKVWHHRPSAHPRASHAAMDGEKVGLDEKFSNGAQWPGDSALGPEETCNCHCQVEIELEDGTSRAPLTARERETVDEVAGRLGLGDDYDPYDLHAAYAKCLQTAGIDEGEWSGLTIKQQGEVIAELKTRDAEWVAHGSPAPVDYSRKPKDSLYPHERTAIDYLSEKQGIALTTILEDDNLPANLDIEIDGDGWELKSPGSGKHAVDDRLQDAFRKFRKLGTAHPRIAICNSESTRADDDVLEECLRRMRHRKKTDDLELIDFIFLSHDGDLMRRFKI